MAETIDDLTVTFTEDGVETVKQVGKVVLTKGAWSTIIFRLQVWDNKTQSYSPDRYTIRRYQKREGRYQLRSKFNISSKDQAQQIIDVLTKWINEN